MNENTKDIFHRDIKRSMWQQSLGLSVILLLFFTFFVYILDGSFSFFTVSKALAGTAALFIGASFALSGFCYYWDFLDTKIAYRKYLGLVGYWYAVLYSISLLIVDPETYFFGFFENLYTPDVLLGLASMALFTIMALLSNNSAMKALGPQRWRKLFRVGYVAWLLLAIRAYIIEQELWHSWIASREGFPPPRMLLSLFVVTVILFRISIEISKRIRKNNSHTSEKIR
jgi:DMSO/TMAO reductase YedYZ heme-binding membrane subunit